MTCLSVYIKLWDVICKHFFLFWFILTEWRINASVNWTFIGLYMVMPSCLLGTQALSEPLVAYCQLDPWKRCSVKIRIKTINFLWRKCFWNWRLQQGGVYWSNDDKDLCLTGPFNYLTQCSLTIHETPRNKGESSIKLHTCPCLNVLMNCQ